MLLNYAHFLLIEKILDIDATDCDSGVNKEITFSIVAGLSYNPHFE